jgi:hypothetical protein
MPEVWKQEGLRCAGSYLRGDFKEELKAKTALASCGASAQGDNGTPDDGCGL